METRSLVLVAAAITLIAACCLLATGWMKTAEDAAAETQRCELRQRKRVADVPRITIGLNVVYRDEVIAPVDALARAGGFTIDALYKRLKRDRRSDCDPSVVCLDNLIALQLTASTSNSVVDMIVQTAWAAGYDIVVTPVPNNKTW